MLKLGPTNFEIPSKPVTSLLSNRAVEREFYFPLATDPTFQFSPSWGLSLPLSSFMLLSSD